MAIVSLVCMRELLPASLVTDVVEQQEFMYVLTRLGMCMLLTPYPCNVGIYKSVEIPLFFARVAVICIAV
jgi:hypothetical protein